GYLFPFDAGSGGYQMVNPPNGVLEPWKGYWFLAYSDCDLWIPPAPCPPPPPQSLQRVDLQALMAQGIPTPPPPPMLSTMHESILAESVTVGNTPNPVRSHNTTTFFVSGPMSELVDAILLRIYDLSGVLVYEQEAGSTEIDWHTDNSTGDLLANGVYLYQIWIKSDGVWSPMEIRKVVVLR
ncbi:T9SS type A sorting domain-containing protein, partial [Candidatus Bipolaricaulota bacterium]|nr:T9SS type A sorting domain-containing protein [Candidatus Bipolaricaulota bacterium]